MRGGEGRAWQEDQRGVWQPNERCVLASTAAGHMASMDAGVSVACRFGSDSRGHPARLCYIFIYFARQNSVAAAGPDVGVGCPCVLILLIKDNIVPAHKKTYHY